MKEEERASQHSALFNPCSEASVNTTSSYKQGQKAGQQAAQGSNRGNGNYRGGGGHDQGQSQASGGHHQNDCSQSQDRRDHSQSQDCQSFPVQGLVRCRRRPWSLRRLRKRPVQIPVVTAVLQLRQDRANCPCLQRTKTGSRTIWLRSHRRRVPKQLGIYQ